MRTLTDHKITGLNDALEITVLDEPGHGGACHSYDITINGQEGFLKTFCIHFQEGPIQEHGVNGISGESLIAVNIDRLRGFQAGPYASADNAEALHHLEMAMLALQRRTLKRIARGVEGTHQK